MSSLRQKRSGTKLSQLSAIYDTGHLKKGNLLLLSFMHWPLTVPSHVSVGQRRTSGEGQLCSGVPSAERYYGRGHGGQTS